jgi:hypothetical protein
MSVWSSFANSSAPAFISSDGSNRPSDMARQMT